jgi:predicted  nucleic acid-binding Zn-ribbon protein
MAMSKTIHQKMHEQHVKWQRDYETWSADIDQWKKELQGALTDLSEAESALHDSLNALDSHAETNWENQQQLKAHEAVVSEEARMGESKTDRDWSVIHRDHSSQHERAIETHERIRKHHHEVVVEAVRLLNQVRSAM